MLGMTRTTVGSLDMLGMTRTIMLSFDTLGMTRTIMLARDDANDCSRTDSHGSYSYLCFYHGMLVHFIVDKLGMTLTTNGEKKGGIC